MLRSTRRKALGRLAFLPIILLFAVASWIDAPLRPEGYPVLPRIAQSDQAYVANMVLAQENPHLFSRDYFFYKAAHYSYYYPALVALVRWSGRLAGDYMEAYCWFGPVVTFVQLSGFFLLGRAFFNQTLAGILLALASLGVCGITGLGSWQPNGLLARGVFNALLPYLLTAVWCLRGWRASWPLVLAACGVLIHVSALSAMVWAPALLLACLSGGVEDWRQKAPWLFISALIFGVLTLGSAAGRVAEKRSLTESEFNNFLEARTLRHPASILSPVQSVLGVITGAPDRSFSKLVRLGGRWVLKNAVTVGPLPFLLLGFGAFMVGMRQQKTREASLWIGLLAVGIALGSLIIPLLVEQINLKTRTVPWLFELARGIGYLFPLALLLHLLAGTALARWTSERFGRPSLFPRLQAVFWAGLVLFWLSWFPPQAFSKWIDKQPDQVKQGEKLKEVLRYIRDETPPETVLVGYEGSRYLPWPPDDLAVFIRLYGKRSVSFCWKDGSSLMLLDPTKFLSWAQKYRTARRTLSAPWGIKNDIPGFCVAARSWGADLWLAPTGLLNDARATGFPLDGFVRYRNEAYALVDLSAFERGAASLHGSPRNY